MAYYGVLAGSARYHGEEALTYISEEPLLPGSIVEVPLRSQLVIGVVLGPADKPKFDTKNITRVFDLPLLPRLSIELMEWLRSYYPAPLGSVANLFLPTSLTKKPIVEKDQTVKPVTSKLPALTEEQTRVVHEINEADSTTVLLHGDTGTGKTRVYLELAKEQLDYGKDVLILTPEIGLTPQLIRDFEKTFSNQVIVLHSNLTPAQRRKAWLHVLKSKTPIIAVGPRSALFAPFRQLGLIVVDEAHESSYKQEQQPRYQALRVASQLANLHNAKLIIGSATPTVAEYYIAEQKKVPILRMQQLAVKSTTAEASVAIVDAKNKDLFTRNYILSDELLNAIDQALRSKHQSLVFLNRRGTARLVLCQTCGWEQHCPNCDLPLTYHGDHHEVRCHTCGYKSKAPINCPVCRSSDIIYRSMGTKSVVDIVAKFFPDANIKRFDTDNTKEEQLVQQYDSLANGDIDILVGTQIIAKGLDLPNLSVVGVVAADGALSFPDFTADERTYQLLSQVIGRVGRGHVSGKAIVQTYHPNNPTILAAVNRDWGSFYATQLQERQLYGFPPFYHLLKLVVVRKTAEAARLAAEKQKFELLKLGLKIEVTGPSPSFYEKSRLGYQWQLVIKAKQRSQLLAVINQLPSGWTYDIDPSNLL